MPFINKSPLNYPANAFDAIRIFADNRPPTSADYKNFIIGDEWNDTLNRDFWKMVFRDSTQGLWRKMAGPSDVGVEFFTPDAGGQVGPDGLNNINLVGAAGIVTTGTPGTNTLTISLAGGATAIDTITGNAGGAVPPDAVGNFNIVGTATNGINTVGNPGTNTLTPAFQSPYADGDFEFRNTAAATSRTLSVTNTNVAAASTAEFLMEVPTASADPFLRFNIAATQNYSFGVDNSDSDILKLTDGASPSAGTNILAFDPTNSNAITFNNVYEFPTADGTANQTLITDGAGKVNWGASTHNTGEVVQYVYNSIGTLITIAAVIPRDNSIPQVGEGTEVLSHTITPTSATNRLVVKFNTWATFDGGAAFGTAAMFQDGAANAVSAVSLGDDTNAQINYSVVAGGVGAITFSVRAGPVANNIYINGTSVGQIYGGVSSTTLEVWEIKV